MIFLWRVTREGGELVIIVILTTLLHIDAIFFAVRNVLPPSFQDVLVADVVLPIVRTELRLFRLLMMFLLMLLFSLSSFI